METLRQLKTLLIVFVIIAFVALLEAFKLAPPGVFVGAVEVIFEAVAAAVLVYRTLITDKDLRLSRFMLAGFFAVLASADFSYVLICYVLKINHRTPVAVFFSTFLYSVAFILAISAMFIAFGKRWYRRLWHPTTALPLLIAIPVAVRFLAVPYLADIQSSGMTFFDFSQGLDILTSLFLVMAAILVVLSSRCLFWSFFSCGIITLVLADWAMRVETLLGHAPKFGFYEYFWCVGVLLCTAPIILFKNKIESIPPFSFSSLLASARFWGLVLLFVSVVFLTISQSGNVAAIKIIALGCSLGAVILTVVSHFFAEKMQQFYRIFSETVSDALDPACADSDTPDTRLPVELGETYRLVVRAKIKEKAEREAKGREIAIHKAQSEIAKQVAHNIRSPLSALEATTDQLGPLSEDLRILIRSSVTRIRDVANNLISQHYPTDRACGGDQVATIALASLVDSAISEKRTEFRSKSGVQIEFKADSNGYGLFARVKRGELQTVISNLITNSIEAIGKAGRVTVNLQRLGDNTAAITIRDNGKGISSDLLPRLFVLGATFGKLGGSGRGLYHAKTQVESWGGEIKISSTERVGTEVRILLPLVAAPSWFLESVTLSHGDTVAVLDDDSAIHQIWKSRLETEAMKEKSISVLHFSTPFEVRQALEGRSSSGRLICLFDHELCEFKETGLDLLKDIPSAALRVLVTSHSEESEIQSACTQSGSRLLPKDMAAFIPIRFADKSAEAPSVVILDDDQAMVRQYVRAFSGHGLKAEGFTNSDSLLTRLERFSPATAFVVDQNLADDADGIEIARQIVAAGKPNVILNTGESDVLALQRPWIKQVVQKGRFAELLGVVQTIGQL